MSKEGRAFSDLLKDEASGSKTLPAGLSWDKFFSDVGKELKHLGAQGSHEVAAALFTGNSFIMYPKAGQDSVEQQPMHGVANEHQQEDQGREM